MGLGYAKSIDGGHEMILQCQNITSSFTMHPDRSYQSVSEGR